MSRTRIRPGVLGEPRHAGPRNPGPRNPGPRNPGPRDAGPRDAQAPGAEPPGTLERPMAVIAVAAVLGALAAAGVPTAGAGVVAGVLLTLWAPGAALLLALGPLAPLRGPARHALAIPASLAVSSLLAVGADRLHLGLRPQVLTLASLLAIVVLLAIAMVRLHRARRPR